MPTGYTAEVYDGTNTDCGEGVMNKEDRERLRRLLATGTPGPWRSAWEDPPDEAGEGGPVIYREGPDDLKGVIEEFWYDGPRTACTQPDAALICGAVNALPALLDALDAAERNRDDAMIRAAEDQDEHSAQRAALAAEVERLRAWVREALPYTDPDAEVVIPTALALQARGRALLGEEG